MSFSSNQARKAENGSTTTLALPPSYSADGSGFSLDEFYQTKPAKTTNKAWSSGPWIDPVASTVVPATEILTHSPPAKSVLTRGLQIPTRHNRLTSSYPFPEVLQQAGVTRDEWRAFTREVRKYASLSKSQWAGTLAGTFSITLLGFIFVGGFAIIPATIYGFRMCSKKEHLNFVFADHSGALAQCVSRWNQSYFRAKSLAVRVDIPERSTDLEHMDLSSSKLYKNQQKSGNTSYSPGVYDRKSELKETRARMRAFMKARIVIVPLDHCQNPILQTPRLLSAFPGMDEVKDDEVSEVETEVANDDVSVTGPLLPKKDAYPDEPKP
ncbi:hypothetical protein MMC29_007795 [Sticta canariensis]|nr:hypothetical protein [Sticta canariensis]